MKPKILTLYVLKEMAGPTLLGFTFYTSIILMQKLFDFAGMIIRRSLPAGAVFKLLILSLPWIVVLTIPMALLFGILIAVGRLSADSEIIAMRALGISTRTIYLPVFLFSFGMFLINLYLMNYVTPKGNAAFQAFRAELFTASVEKEIKPRVFYDEYENLMIYINDVDPATSQWKGVFVADSRGDESMESGTPQQIVERAAQRGENPNVGALGAQGGQKIIVAETGTLSILESTKQVWMNLRQAETHVWDPRQAERYDLNRNALQRILLPDRFAGDTASVAGFRSLREMDLRELLQQEKQLRNSKNSLMYNLARVEIHKKFAIPFACIVFGILGLPLGITNRRGGKSSGFSLSIAIIVFYYVMINNGEHLAASGKVPPAIGMWAANIMLLVLGIYLVARANRDAGAQRSEGGIFRRMVSALRTRAARAKNFRRVEAAHEEGQALLSRLDVTFPNTLDRYILREFVKILLLVLISTAALFMIVDYTDLAGDIREHNISLDVLVEYYRFLIFQVLNWTLPISVLVATLVTFGLLSKNNEVTAFKSGGVSLYRVALPVIAVAGLISILSYFILDFVLPYSNRRVQVLRDQIKGKNVAKVTSSSQQKLWFLGKGRYLINFLSYDRNAKQLSQVQVFEFHPNVFRLTRRVYADRAKWNGRAWVFEGGWMRSFTENGQSTFSPILMPIPLYYSETPEDFATEVKAPDQMTFAQLRRYIDTIRKSGYAAEELSVKLYTKTSWPVLSLVMALIALPFAFRIGKRGALYGVGIALVLGIFYWMVFAVFTKFGDVGNLPPLLSAWSANILFAIAAVYLFLNVET